MRRKRSSGLAHPHQNEATRSLAKAIAQTEAPEISNARLRLDVPATSPHHGRRLGVSRFAPSLRSQYGVASSHGGFSLRLSLRASAFLVVAIQRRLLPWPECSSRVTRLGELRPSAFVAALPIRRGPIRVGGFDS
jgi:hypothetical protein